MKIEREDHNRIIIRSDAGGFITSQTVEANLLFAILEKLGKLHHGLFDTKKSINPSEPPERKI